MTISTRLREHDPVYLLLNLPKKSLFMHYSRQFDWRVSGWRDGYYNWFALHLKLHAIDSIKVHLSY